MKPLNVINAIELGHSELRKSERKVADYILQQPDQVIHLRIVDLAQQAGVSEPTVVRFCRAIGCDGFQDFKLLFSIANVTLGSLKRIHVLIGLPCHTVLRDVLCLWSLGGDS